MLLIQRTDGLYIAPRGLRALPKGTTELSLSTVYATLCSEEV